MVMVMVMVATLTRPTAACPLGQEGRCAEDGVSGVEEREKGGQESGEGRGRACVCVWGSGEWSEGGCVGEGESGGWGKGEGRKGEEDERRDIGAERVKWEGKERHEECACERV